MSNVSNLVKRTDYNTNINEIENKITTAHDHDKYITTKEFNKLKETVKGEKAYNVQFSKITKSWSSKLIKKEKYRRYLHRMVKESVECVTKKERPKKPFVPDLPKNIASIPKPDKTVVIENQRSYFGN